MVEASWDLESERAHDHLIASDAEIKIDRDCVRRLIWLA
jgi:hypothetical protein